MIEVCRIVESQSRLYAQQATSSYEHALYIESLLETTKPSLTGKGWHPLIATPFRYALPVPEIYRARFRPAFYSKNVLYACREYRTALYEHAFHFLHERIHLNKAIRDRGQRTIFSLSITSPQITDIRTDPNIQKIMDRHDYGPSHEYLLAHPEVQVILYPSCRDPQHGECYAVFDIHCLAPGIGTERTLSYSFEPDKKAVIWMDDSLQIKWDEVS